MSSFTIGNVVRATGTFKTLGVLSDPSTVAVDITDPLKNVTTYVYGTDDELVRDSPGLYHLDIDGDIKGSWKYRFYSTGEGKANEYKTFTVTV